jgi:2-polyprenyl-3-methyl-5-hydroxy-6-metoxy-1,4-benzoquinol methylase
MYQEDIAFQARLYDDPNPTRRGLHRARKAWVESRLERYLRPGAAVLEVGVGCGLFTQFLSGKAAKVTAVDINQSFLDGVGDLPGVTTTFGDATSDLGLRDFDVGLSSEVIEHVPPARSGAMLKEFFRALKPGGVLVLTTPQSFSTLELTARLLRFPPVLALARRIYGSADDLGHINLMTRGTLQKQIAAAGFEIVENEVFGFYLPGLAEFGGTGGARLLVALGKLLARLPVVSGLLWTQGYVLRKPA